MADKKIDPRIFLPIVEGYSYKETLGGTEGVAQGVEELEYPTSTSGLMPPSNVVIVDQVYRKGADGRTVVDIVLEVEDVPGATEYEVRSSIV